MGAYGITRKLRGKNKGKKEEAEKLEDNKVTNKKYETYTSTNSSDNKDSIDNLKNTIRYLQSKGLLSKTYLNTARLELGDGLELTDDMLTEKGNKEVSDNLEDDNSMSKVARKEFLQGYFSKVAGMEKKAVTRAFLKGYYTKTARFKWAPKLDAGLGAIAGLGVSHIISGKKSGDDKDKKRRLVRDALFAAAGAAIGAH